MNPRDGAVALLALGPVTAVISGAIVVGGNSARWLEDGGEVYWREKTRRCAKTPTEPGASQPALECSYATVSMAAPSIPAWSPAFAWVTRTRPRKAGISAASRYS